MSFYEKSRESYFKAYPKIRSAIDNSAVLGAALKAVSKGFTAFLYFSYGAGLVYLFTRGEVSLFSVYLFVVVPLMTFIVTTVVRDRINAPRPYELYDIRPLIQKSTKGHSCPSRHTACAFAVAFMMTCFLRYFVGADTLPIGIIYIMIACIVAASRVLIGVHFPFDVLCGFIIAFVIQLAGMLPVFPLLS